LISLINKKKTNFRELQKKYSSKTLETSENSHIVKATAKADNTVLKWIGCCT